MPSRRGARDTRGTAGRKGRRSREYHTSRKGVRRVQIFSTVGHEGMDHVRKELRIRPAATCEGRPPGDLPNSQAIQDANQPPFLSWMHGLNEQGEGVRRTCGRGPGGGARRGRRGHCTGEAIRGRGAAGVSRGRREGEGAREAGTAAGEFALVDVALRALRHAKILFFAIRISVRMRPKAYADGIDVAQDAFPDLLSSWTQGECIGGRFVGRSEG